MSFDLRSHSWSVFSFFITSDTPEVCLLPAGVADKNKLVLYHPLYVSTKIYQNKNKAAVRQSSSTYSGKGQRSGDGCKVIGWGNRVPPTGLPIEQVLGEYPLS